MNKCKLITRQEAAELIGTTRQTIQNWIDKGVFKVKTIGKTQYISLNEIEALIGDLKNVETSRKKLKEEQEEVERLLKEEEKNLHDLRVELKVFPPCLEAGIRADFLSSVLDMTGDQINHREKQVLYDILQGWSVLTIADRLCLIRERVRQIAYKAVRRAGNLINLKEVE